MIRSEEAAAPVQAGAGMAGTSTGAGAGSSGLAAAPGGQPAAAWMIGQDELLAAQEQAEEGWARLWPQAGRVLRARGRAMRRPPKPQRRRQPSASALVGPSISSLPTKVKTEYEPPKCQRQAQEALEWE